MMLELEMGTKDNWPPNLTSNDSWGGQQMNLKWNHKWTRTSNDPQLIEPQMIFLPQITLKEDRKWSHREI